MARCSLVLVCLSLAAAAAFQLPSTPAQSSVRRTLSPIAGPAPQIAKPKTIIKPKTGGTSSQPAQVEKLATAQPKLQRKSEDCPMWKVLLLGDEEYEVHPASRSQIAQPGDAAAPALAPWGSGSRCSRATHTAFPHPTAAALGAAKPAGLPRPVAIRHPQSDSCASLPRVASELRHRSRHLPPGRSKEGASKRAAPCSQEDPVCEVLLAVIPEIENRGQARAP